MGTGIGGASGRRINGSSFCDEASGDEATVDCESGLFCMDGIIRMGLTGPQPLEEGAMTSCRSVEGLRFAFVLVGLGVRTTGDDCDFCDVLTFVFGDWKGFPKTYVCRNPPKSMWSSHLPAMTSALLCPLLRSTIFHLKETNKLSVK